MSLILKFLGGLLGSLIAKAVGFLMIFLAGEKAQQTKDLEATQTTEQEAADAKARVDTDAAYRDKLRQRYTADK